VSRLAAAAARALGRPTPGPVTQEPLNPRVEEACEHREIGKRLDRVADQHARKEGQR